MKGRKLEINRSLNGKNGIQFRSLSPVVKAGEKAPKPSNPKAEIFVKGGDGKAVATGKLEYG